MPFLETTYVIIAAYSLHLKDSATFYSQLCFASLFSTREEKKEVVQRLGSLNSLCGSRKEDKREAGCSVNEEDFQDETKTMSLGHACFLVELAFVGSSGRGAWVLFDPVFSDRCSPSQFLVPKRYTEPPCKIKDIPEVDWIVISYSHYDQYGPSSLDHAHAPESSDARQSLAEPEDEQGGGYTEYDVCLDHGTRRFSSRQMARRFSRSEPQIEIDLKTATPGMEDTMANINAMWFGHTCFVVECPGEVRALSPRAVLIEKNGIRTDSRPSSAYTRMEGMRKWFIGHLTSQYDAGIRGRAGGQTEG
ncbi:hypothetical protein ARMSODRAFT_1004779 [Armillaria solidipes]|uniref:Metallo-beta-lactamase domain-containing protein n=1 Tax=Armillaria solidipes TaxID=1076256 RepID=A0A2H3BHL3_9AGAR|nr:hypothetical protein ARMSODRAFT_1004779 [Armillaria solidipes]